MKRSFRVFKDDGTEVTPVRIYEDTRSSVDRMFYEWDEAKGEKVALQIIALDCSKATPGQQGVKLRDCIPILKSYLESSEDVPVTDQGKDLIIFGGVRLGPTSVGRLRVPIDEVEQFCALIKQIAALVKESQGA